MLSLLIVTTDIIRTHPFIHDSCPSVSFHAKVMVRSYINRDPRSAFTESLPIDDDTAVGVDSLPRDGRAIRAGKEDEARRNLTRLQRPPHRTCELLHRLIGHGRRDQRRPNRARRHGINPDAPSNVLVGQAAGKGDDGAFGGSIVKKVRTTDVGVYGSVVDDGAAARHVGEGVFGHEKEGVDVCVEGVEPLFPGYNIKQSVTS